MEYMQYIVPTNFCCVIISRTKNDTAILQQEVEKLSLLEEECNKKLDEFYASKQEFEFMLANLYDKVLRDEIYDLTNEKAIIDEFIDYVTSVWQSGADKLGQAQKKIQYISSVEGLPLSVYIQLLQNNIEKASMSIAQTICHPSCTTLFYSMYNEITGELFVRLSTADICFRQYEYLKRSLPFLNKLKDFIKTYIDKETIYSVKLFSDEIMSGISLKLLGDENYDDKENLGAFRNVVNLLTGKLLGYDYILEPHSEITPIVSDIFTQKPSKKIIVKQLVNFFLKDELESIKNLYEDNCNNKFIINNENFNLYSTSLKETERFNRMIDPAAAFINLSEPIVDMNGSLYQLQENSGTLFEASSVYDPYQQCLSSTSLFNQAFPNSLFTFESQRYLEPNGKNTKFNSTPQKRGRKANSTIENSGDFSCDLKPIKIPKLKQDLIKPLT